MLLEKKEKWQKTIKSQDPGENRVALFLSKQFEKRVNKLEQLKTTLQENLEQRLNTYQKIEGISLWKVNRKLNRLAVKGIPKDVLKEGKYIMQLPDKEYASASSSHQVQYIEKTINALEGFENLRLSHFYSYTPKYVEKKVFGAVTRQLEIEIS